MYFHALLLCLIVGSTWVNCNALTGFLCGKGKLNITTISATTVQECDLMEIEPDSQAVRLQLLQKIDYQKEKVQKCYLKVDRHIQYCGMHSHVSEVDKGESTFLETINRETCIELLRFGQFKYFNKIISDLKLNATNRESITIIGRKDDKGNCEGGEFVSDGHEYSSVVVSVKLELTISEIYVSVNKDNNKLYLNSGVRCSYSTGHCIDDDGGHVYWDVIGSLSCQFDNFAILFEGIGTKVQSNTSKAPVVYFANSTEGIQFGLASAGSMNLCGFKIFKTEHPKLFIYELATSVSFAKKTSLNVQDILLTAYYNTKISYLSRHVKTQFNSLYKDVLFHRCNLERRSLIESLSLARSDPEGFALSLMKEQGYTAILAGEVTHIIKCQHIECKVRHLPDCYQELPAVCGEQDVFLKPRSRIITFVGSPIECNRLLPSIYNIGGDWHQMTPAPVKIITPQILQPMVKPTWKYEDLEGIFDHGIYSNQDLEKFHEHVMFNAEKPALIEAVAKRLSDRANSPNSPNFDNLLNPDSIIKVAESTFARAWSGFIKFGSAAAGVMAIFIIIQAVKMILDTVIRGYTLYTVYGWSMRLLGAVWSSLTYLLLHVCRPRTSYSPTNETPVVETDSNATSTQPLSTSRPQAASRSTTSRRPERRESAYQSMPTARRSRSIEELEKTIFGVNRPSVNDHVPS